MRTNQNMTIQDYFREIGHRSIAVHPESNLKSRSQESDRSFARILDGKHVASEVRQGGLTIRDYISKPVVVRPPVNLGDMQQTRQDDSPQPTQTSTKDQSLKPHHVLPKDVLPPGVVQPRPGITDVAKRIEGGIETAAHRYNLPKSLVRAVIKAESGFQVRAVSPAGAQGLMQLMPATAKEMGVTDAFDIDQNIDGGAKYLRAMLDRFDGDVKLALSAYNAGPGTVAKYNGRVPYAETRNYVARVLRFARRST